MIKKDMYNYIFSAMKSLNYDENSINTLISEIKKKINLSVSKNEFEMRKYVETAYNDANFIFNTGHSYLFYKRHNRRPKELILGLDKEGLDYAKKNNLKYITKEELHEVIRRAEIDNKWNCTHCEKFWKSEKIADKYFHPTTFRGENPNYCDKSCCSCPNR